MHRWNYTRLTVTPNRRDSLLLDLPHLCPISTLGKTDKWCWLFLSSRMDGQYIFASKGESFKELKEDVSLAINLVLMNTRCYYYFRSEVNDEKMLSLLELLDGWTDDASPSLQGHQLSNKERSQTIFRACYLQLLRLILEYFLPFDRRCGLLRGQTFQSWESFGQGIFRPLGGKSLLCCFCSYLGIFVFQ